MKPHIIYLTLLLSHPVLAACPPSDANGDNRVSVAEVIAVVNAALDGCPGSAVSPTPTRTALPSPTPGGRFVHVGLTVKDTQTGLIWEAKGSCSDLLDYAGAQARVTDYNRRKVGGRKDWRIPTVDEWRTIEGDDEPSTGFDHPDGRCPCDPTVCNFTSYGDYYSSTPSGDGRYYAVSIFEWELTPGYRIDPLEVRLVAGP